MSLTQNHIQFLRTSGNTAPSASNLLEGELAVNVNASNPKIYLRTKTGIAEFGNDGDNIAVGSNISYEGETLAPATSSVTQVISTLFEYTIDNEETTAAALNDLDIRINALSGKTVADSATTAVSAITSNSAQTLSGFEVVDDSADITYTIPPGKGVGIIVRNGNTIKYKLKDVVGSIEPNESVAPSGKAISRVLINKGQNGDISYRYDYVDTIDKANSATTASQINGMKIETLTRSQYDEKVKENNTLYLIYESPN